METQSISMCSEFRLGKAFTAGKLYVKNDTSLGKPNTVNPCYYDSICSQRYCH